MTVKKSISSKRWRCDWCMVENKQRNTYCTRCGRDIQTKASVR